MNCIPAELRTLQRWVCWRYEDTGGPKPAKVPHTTSGYHTSAARKRHVTYAEVCDALSSRPDYFSGIGFVFAAGDGYTGVDFDNCLDEHGAFCNPWAETWVRRLNSYSEISPSGRGVKVIVRGHVPRALKQAQIEIYDRARYFTITARLLPGAPTTIRDTQAELDELFAALRPAATDVDTTSPVTIADAEVRAELDHFAGLLDDTQIPRCLTGRSVGRRILRAALAGWPDGAPNYSVERFHLMGSLVMHGYSDAQIAAALWYYRPVLNGGGKTEANWGADIARVIGKWRAAHPDWQPTPKGRMVNVVTTSLQVPEPPASASRARKDRPQKVAGAIGYLAWLHAQADGGAVMLSAHECAERLGCSLRTIRRYERELTGNDPARPGPQRIERRAFAQRQAGCVFLLDADLRGDNIPAHEPAQVEPDPPQPDAPNDVDTTVPTMEDHTFVLSSGLRALVAEAFDIYADAPKRKRKSLVRHHVTANSTRRWEPDDFDSAYRAELLRRDVAATPTLNGLRRALRLNEHRAERAEEQGDPSAIWWRFTIDVLAAEMRRRPPDPQRTRRKVCEVLPDTRRAGERHQAELWAALERDREDRAPPRTTKPVCPSHTPNAAGLIARLKADKAARAAFTGGP